MPGVLLTLPADCHPPHPPAGEQRATDRHAVGPPGGPAQGLPAGHGGGGDAQPRADLQSASHRQRPGAAQGTPALEPTPGQWCTSESKRVAFPSEFGPTLFKQGPGH